MRLIGQGLAVVLLMASAAELQGQNESKPNEGNRESRQQGETRQRRTRETRTDGARPSDSRQNNNRSEDTSRPTPGGNTNNNAPANNTPAATPAPAAQGSGSTATQPGNSVPVASRAAAGPSLGEFRLNLDSSARLLHHHAQGQPRRQDVTVPLGEELVTEISFDNKDQTGFDEIRVILSYEPEKLEPISISDKTIAGLLAGPPTAEVDTAFGIILYEAKLREPATFANQPILALRWKTKAVAPTTMIEFSSRENYYSAINQSGVDLLGNKRDASDGTLNLAVTIVPADPREAEVFLKDPVVYQPRSEKTGGVRLSLQGPGEAPVVGKPFDVDVILDNRAFSMLDGLDLLISFDPEVIQVIDHDLDNFITRETNILDGPFQQKYPWDYIIDNKVYHERGLITYRVGTSDAQLTRGKIGTVARIRAVAKKPTAGTWFDFKFSKNPRTNATEAVYVGADVLGDPDVFADGTENLRLPVLAAPPKELAATNKKD